MQVAAKFMHQPERHHATEKMQYFFEN